MHTRTWAVSLWESVADFWRIKEAVSTKKADLKFQSTTDWALRYFDRPRILTSQKAFVVDLVGAFYDTLFINKLMH